MIMARDTAIQNTSVYCKALSVFGVQLEESGKSKCVCRFGWHRWYRVPDQRIAPVRIGVRTASEDARSGHNVWFVRPTLSEIRAEIMIVSGWAYVATAGDLFKEWGIYRREQR